MLKKHYIFIVLIIVITNIITIYIFDKRQSRNKINTFINTPTTLSTQGDFQTIVDFENSRRTAITEAVRMIESAVVCVNVIKTEIVNENMTLQELYLSFHGLHILREVQSIATGVLFRSDGYIITNSHVIENANQITVVMTNNEVFEAYLVGLDPLHDIAVIKIEGTNLPYARLGTSSDLIIGEWSIAVGNPYGFMMGDNRPSVSVGVISALGRNFSSIEPPKIFKGMIQTDAAINPGNSGGPLVNIHGEVIGINSFILTQTGGSVGIGFAIPIDRIKRISSELIEFGRVRSVYLGFNVQELTHNIATSLRLQSLDGIIVSSIEPEGPAEKAGLKRGDVIIRIDDIIIRNSIDASIGVSDLVPGGEATFYILREGRELQIVLIGGDFY